MFSMLMLVLANNYLLMFLGWEGVGLCSYLLIGFWYEKKSAADAGKKALLSTESAMPDLYSDSSISGPPSGR